MGERGWCGRETVGTGGGEKEVVTVPMKLGETAGKYSQKSALPLIHIVSLTGL